MDVHEDIYYELALFHFDFDTLYFFEPLGVCSSLKCYDDHMAIESTAINQLRDLLRESTTNF